MIWLLLDLLPFVVILFVWQSLFQGASTLKGYTLGQIVGYYLFVILIEALTEVHFEEWRCREIRDGKIDHYLLKPQSYLSQLFWREVSGKLFYLTMFVPWFVGLLWGGSQFYQLDFNIDPTRMLLVATLLLAAFILNYSISSWVVLGTFWLEGSQGLEHFKWLIIAIFSGTMLPVTFMPPLLQQVISFLPFKYLYAVPIGLLQGTYQLKSWDIWYVSWCLIVCLTITQLLWRSAQHRYSSVA